MVQWDYMTTPNLNEVLLKAYLNTINQVDTACHKYDTFLKYDRFDISRTLDMPDHTWFVLKIRKKKEKKTWLQFWNHF